MASATSFLSPRAFSPAALLQGDKNLVREMWDRLSGLPLGKQVFSRAIGMTAPYTATIGAQVTVLRSGYAEVVMRDKPGLRNHLASVHAVALVNLAELAGNIALSYSLPDDARFIVSALSIEYLKKARGTLRATSECPIPASSERKEYIVPVSIWNSAGEEVARAKLTSLVGPKRQSQGDS